MLRIIQERTRNNELEMLNVNVNIVLCCAIEGCPFMMSWNEMDNVGFVNNRKSPLFGCHSILIILPRQARNRHRESTRKRGAFCVSQVAAVDNDVIAHEKRIPSDVDGIFCAFHGGAGSLNNWVRKTPLLEPFSAKHDHFTKTTSGQT